MEELGTYDPRLQPEARTPLDDALIDLHAAQAAKDKVQAELADFIRTHCFDVGGVSHMKAADATEGQYLAERLRSMQSGYDAAIVKLRAAMKNYAEVKLGRQV
jgi:hypothetical protein